MGGAPVELRGVNELETCEAPPPYTQNPLDAPPLPSTTIVVQPTTVVIEERCRKGERCRRGSHCSVHGHDDSGCLICCCVGPRICIVPGPVYSGGGGGGGGGCCCCTGCGGCGNCKMDGRSLLIALVCAVLLVGVVMMVIAWRMKKSSPPGSKKWLLLFVPGVILAVAIPAVAVTLIVVYWDQISTIFNEESS